MGAHTVLTDSIAAEIDARLADTDELLSTAYPGERGSRQPVHTVYVPADQFHPGLCAEWGRDALAVADGHGGIGGVSRAAAIETPDAVADAVRRKLETEPIEDLRLDFEDGYGDRGDAVEDDDAERAAAGVAEAVCAGTTPPFIGIRFKCFEEPTRRRGLRTLDLFISALMDAGGLPDGLVLTLPKVSTGAQVEAMVAVCAALEAAHGLDHGRLRFEVQVETPQLILGADGTVPLARAVHAGNGRVSGLHYGTYDYSASLQIAAGHQSMDHPAADFAKQIMQVVAAGTGVRLSDGSSNVLPVGDPDAVAAAWRLHGRLVGRSLAAGFYQGWDMHPAQLLTRYLATYRFYRSGFEAAAGRLHDYIHQVAGAVLDEPATAKALADFLRRGVSCGAVGEAEIADKVGIPAGDLSGIGTTKGQS
ncbi:DUF6986 family protein [Spelaeicoccus albus]|uniref:Citrate lyase beta subunit n=1 Tax=Spelaeicoccus albus TaxID=1280376 RepID=A0A7Z0D204_9MICO|nr:aldolase/citrate lyase family protein [Spelaeicoccus albus]NYI67362.1 citrate lyase beta subunit [Spelaeicoccus albus]